MIPQKKELVAFQEGIKKGKILKGEITATNKQLSEIVKTIYA